MRILVVDDNRLVRQGILGLLADQEGCEVCGEAGDSVEAIKKAVALRPDLILLDVSMPGKNGLETIGAFRQTVPAAKILMITQHDSKRMLPHSLEAGAHGCVDKARLGVDLLPAIKSLNNTSASRPD